MSAYEEFLARKTQHGGGCGFTPDSLPDYLFPFQRDLVTWAIEQGRAALFADCGLGKTPMELTWADAIHRRTGKPVLIVTPLAVSFQTEREADKFGFDAAISRDGRIPAPLTITNYERLENFQPDKFGGVVCDESSAIKAFDGKRRAIVTEFLRTLPFRLLATATAAPNDYVELGTSSEALGQLGHMDMLNRFFTNKLNNSSTGRYRGQKAEWRFKGHAEQGFWRWVSSWARAMRRPSDLGYADDGFALPPLETRFHVVKAHTPRSDTLFDSVAVGLQEEREELRRTITERCETAAELVEDHDISILWCHLNDEGDLLERLIPFSLQVKGSDSDEYKEAAVRWFTGNLCICDMSMFRRKLAAWFGSLNMPNVAAPSINQTPRNENGGRVKEGILRPTVSTCGTGTRQIRTGSASTEEQLSTTGTLSDGCGTPPIPSIAGKNATRQNGGSAPTPTNGSLNGSSASASPLIGIERCLTSRAADAPFVNGAPKPDEGDSMSTTVTKLDSSEDSSAPSAISDWESSATIRAALSAPHCICGHASGVRRLISKPVMFGWGLNFQHCAHVVYFPSHSYEAFYQAIRRSWRFGQQNPVTVDVISTDGTSGILDNLQRKADQADRMFESLVAHMRDGMDINPTITYPNQMEAPSWLTS